MNIAGKKVPSWAVYGGIGVAVVGGVLYFKNRSSTAATSAAAAVDPNAIDPNTGMTYASEQAGTLGGTSGFSGLGFGTPTVDTSAAGTTVGTAYTSNAQWSQAVEAGLTALGWDAQAVGAAVGKYLLSMPLTADQVTIVQTAVAEYGPPPVGTYAIIAKAAPPPSTSGGGTPTPHGTLAAPGGFRVARKSAHEFTVSWNKVSGATGYHVQVKQLNGKTVADQQTTSTSVSIPGRPGWSYRVGLQALPGGHGTNLTVTLPHH